MGSRANRERAQSGILFRNGKLVDSSEVKVVREISEEDRNRYHERGEKKLRSMSTNKQIKVLADSLHQGRLSKEQLRSELEKAAISEMAKGAKRLRNKKKEVTVDALLKEYRDPKNWELKDLSSKVGLDENWFISLAECEVKKEG